MNKTKKAFKIVGIVFASILSFFVLCHATLMVWIRVAPDNDLPLFIHNAIKSVFFFDNYEDQNVIDAKHKSGGIMRGICNPGLESTSVAALSDANINWTRIDITNGSPIELDSEYNPIIHDGKYLISSSLEDTIRRVDFYRNNNQKVMLITGYPEGMLNAIGERDTFIYGGEFSEKFKNYLKITAQVYAEYLSDKVSAFQISNELDIEKWRGALTIEQAAFFIGEQMKAMYDICKDKNCLIGFNQSMLGKYKLANILTREYGKYFDFAGCDLYIGSFEQYTRFMFLNDMYVKYLYYVTRKPIVITEFGYTSAGQVKTDKEKEEYLRNEYGEKFDTEAKIKNNFVEFITMYLIKSREEKATYIISDCEFIVDYLKHTEAEKQAYLNNFYPYDSIEKMKEDKLGFLSVFEKYETRDHTPLLVNETIRILKSGGYSDESIKNAKEYFFLYGVNHLYQSFNPNFYILGYDHNEEGQAKFIKDFVHSISNKKYVIGFFAYNYVDNIQCYECGHYNCPVETGWGLIRLTNHTYEHFNKDDYVFKKSYFAIKEVYGELANK